MIEIEVGKKYVHSEHGEIMVVGPSFNYDYLAVCTNDECLTRFNDGDRFHEELLVSKNIKEQINLDTHIGKVNSDELYEFSDDGVTWGTSWLVFIRNQGRFKYKAMSNTGEATLWYQYCRLYKEPEQKEYMTIPEAQWFCVNKENIVIKRKDSDGWRFPFVQSTLLVQDLEWTTIDDKTKSYGEAHEFTKNYLG